MTDSQRKYQPSTYYRTGHATIFTPERRNSGTNGKVQDTGTSLSLTPNLKESVLTSFSANPEGSDGFTPYQISLNNQDINSTPSTFRTAKELQTSNQIDRSGSDYKRFKPRIIPQYTPIESRISLGVDTPMRAKEVTSEFGDDIQSREDIDSRQDEIYRLRKQNQDLKRRISLKQVCSCKSPYIQQEVQYLRHHFYNHIQKRHQVQDGKAKK